MQSLGKTFFFLNPAPNFTSLKNTNWSYSPIFTPPNVTGDKRPKERQIYLEKEKQKLFFLIYQQKWVTGLFYLTHGVEAVMTVLSEVSLLKISREKKGTGVDVEDRQQGSSWMKLTVSSGLKAARREEVPALLCG